MLKGLGLASYGLGLSLESPGLRPENLALTIHH